MVQKITPDICQKILQTVNAVTDLRPFGVVVGIDNQAKVIRDPQRTPQDHQFIVIDIKTGTPNISMSEVAGEGAMAALNCTAAVVAGSVTFGTAAAAPISGGSSLLLTGIGLAATSASIASCGISLTRTFNALIFPGRNQTWDNEPAYKTTVEILDGISLIGVGASVASATRVVRLLAKAEVRIPTALNGVINRQEGARLTKEMIKLRRPNVTNKEIKELIKQGLEPRRYPKDLIKAGALKSLKDSIASGLSFLSSSLDGDVKEVSFYLVSLIK